MGLFRAKEKQSTKRQNTTITTVKDPTLPQANSWLFTNVAEKISDTFILRLFLPRKVRAGQVPQVAKGKKYENKSQTIQ